MMGVGRRGRVDPATSRRSSIRSTDWYLFTLASLKSGKLAPYESLSPSNLVNVK